LFHLLACLQPYDPDPETLRELAIDRDGTTLSTITPSSTLRLGTQSAATSDQLIGGAPSETGLGSAVLAKGDKVVVAGHAADAGGNAAGGVWVFDSPSTVGKARLALLGPGSSDAGAALALADLDGDGLDELAIGGPLDDARHGAVWLIDAESAGQLDLDAATPLLGERSSLFGRALATGDTDGDGLVELLVGAPGADSGRGAVFLYEQGIESAAASGRRSWERLGEAVLLADLDGDGLDELVAGVPFEDASSGEEVGGVYVWSRPSASLAPWTADAALRGSANDHRAGTSLTAGDVDGDGADDLLIGSPGHRDVGAVHLVLAPLPDRLDLAHADLRVTGLVADEDFGAAIAATDIDGSGAADLVIGSPHLVGRGAVHIWLDPATSGTSWAADVRIAGAATDDWFGTALAADASVLVVGAPGAGAEERGRGYLWTW